MSNTVSYMLTQGISLRKRLKSHKNRRKILAFSRFIKALSIYMMYALIGLGVVVLMGWQFDIAVIKRPLPGLVAMNPLTATCFILTGVSFLSVGKRIAITRSIALLLMVIVTAHLFLLFSNTTFQLDQQLLGQKMLEEGHDNLSNRMAPNTAISFLFSGLVLLLLTCSTKWCTILAQIFVLLVTTLGMFSVFGYSYGVQEFYGILVHFPMALHTAFGFLIFSIGVLNYSNDKGFMSHVTSVYAGGLIARLLFPLIIVFTFAAGMVTTLLHNNVDISYDFSTAVLVTFLIGTNIIFVWVAVIRLNNNDKLKERYAEELLWSNLLLNSSINSLSDMSVFSIDKNYRVINFNEGFVKNVFNAYRTSVEKNKSIWDIVNIPAHKKIIEVNGGKALSGELVNETRYIEESDRWVDVKYRPMRNEFEEIIGVTVLTEDVTQEKKDQEELIALNKELQSFSYSVAHDLRAPLRIINGYMEIVLKKISPRLSDEEKVYCKVVSSNVLKMGELIDDLLNYIRMGRAELSKKHITMGSLIQGVVNDLMLTEDDSKVTIEVKNTLDLYCDATLIRQVFVNLIGNAVKYSSNKEKSLVEVDSYKENDEIIYYIKDNGAGFDMKYVHKLFGIFQRLHRDSEFKGTGVGLAIVERIITKHGGTVWAEGALGKGATFYFSLKNKLMAQ